MNQYVQNTSSLERRFTAFININFLTRKDLKYKPNALDKARFEFSPLGKAFSARLDKTVPNYQKEGVIKLLKNIRDNLAGNNRPNNDYNRPNNDDNRPNNDDNDEEEFNYEEVFKKLEELDKRFKRLSNKTSDEEEFKKLEELHKRFKRLNNKKCLESLKYLKEKISDNDSNGSDDSKYLKKISSNNPQIRVDALRKTLNSKRNDDNDSDDSEYLKK